MIDLKNTAVHCPTEELAKKVADRVNTLILSGEYKMDADTWKYHKQDTCYNIEGRSFIDKAWYEMNDYKIISAEEFLSSFEELPNVPASEINVTDDLFDKTDADRFKEITDKMYDTFKRKNHDYGNSFSESCDEEGLAASRIRLGDKWKRYKTLSKGEIAQVQDEKIEDTLLDMANYAIMTVIWLQNRKLGSNAK